jgi:hypothetical protein
MGKTKVKRKVFSPEDGDSMFLRNIGIYLRVYTASQSRRTSSTSPPWILRFSQEVLCFWREEYNKIVSSHTDRLLCVCVCVCVCWGGGATREGNERGPIWQLSYVFRFIPGLQAACSLLWRQLSSELIFAPAESRINEIQALQSRDSLLPH